MPSIRPISHTKFEKFLKKIGCVYKRTSGDHNIYHKEGLNRPIVVPISKPLTMNVILSNLRTLKISREEYLEIISKI